MNTERSLAVLLREQEGFDLNQAGGAAAWTEWHDALPDAEMVKVDDHYEALDQAGKLNANGSIKSTAQTADAFWDEILAPKPKPTKATVQPVPADLPQPRKGKKIRQPSGAWKTYKGSKRDRSGDPYWDQTPTNVRLAVAEGRLKAVDMSVAGVIYRHIRKSARYRDKGKRISNPEIARLLGLERESVRQSIKRMATEHELIVLSPGQHNFNGAIYGFPARCK